MKHALKFLGDLPWFAVLLPSLAVLAVTSYYAFSIEPQQISSTPQVAQRSLETQIGAISHQLGQLIGGSDGDATTITISGGDSPQIQIHTESAADSRVAMLNNKEVSEDDLAAAGIIAEEPADGPNSGSAAATPVAQQTAAASRDLEIAIEGELRNVVQTAIANYRIQSNILLIGFVGVLLGLLLITKAMISRQRGAETRLALARSEAERSRLNSEMTAAQLAMMQAQIEPHFLFNTMASVQHLIETDPARAAALQQNLTQYLRAAIPQMREAAKTLGQEIELARAYLGILKARMAERLTFAIDVPQELEAIEFPPMMIMTLLENAIKHGLEPKPEGGHIRIAARVAGDKLRAEVTDTGIGFLPGGKPGVGLANIRERLNLLYGQRASLVIEPNEPSGTRAVIEIPLGSNKPDSSRP